MTEVSFFEQSTSQEFEDKIRRSVGLAFIKPDSIELGVEDFLIEHITKKINEHSKIDLVGGIVLKNLTEKDVGRIYPYLDEKIFRGVRILTCTISGNTFNFRGARADS